MTFKRKKGFLWIFWRFRAATQFYSTRKVSPRNFQPVLVEFMHWIYR